MRPAADSSVIAPLLRVLSSGLLDPSLDSAVSPARVVSRQPTLCGHFLKSCMVWVMRLTSFPFSEFVLAPVHFGPHSPYVSLTILLNRASSRLRESFS